MDEEKKENLSDVSGEDLSSRISQYESELEKYKSKDYNFTEMTKKFEKEKEQILKEKIRLEQEVADRDQRLKEEALRQKEAQRHRALNELVGDSEEERQAVLEAYNRLNDKEDTYEDIVNKMKDARKMALGVEDEKPLINSVTSNAGASYDNSLSNVDKRLQEEFHPDLRKLASRIGLSDEDIKKYGPKVINKR